MHGDRLCDYSQVRDSTPIVGLVYTGACSVWLEARLSENTNSWVWMQWDRLWDCSQVWDSTPIDSWTCESEGEGEDQHQHCSKVYFSWYYEDSRRSTQRLFSWAETESDNFNISSYTLAGVTGTYWATWACVLPLRKTRPSFSARSKTLALPGPRERLIHHE